MARRLVAVWVELWADLKADYSAVYWVVHWVVYWAGMLVVQKAVMMVEYWVG